MRTHHRFAQSARRASLALCLASLIAAALALTGCGAATSNGSAQDGGYKLVEDGKLTVASDLATPPFEYVDDAGNDQGFTVELMDMIAQEMGLELNYLPAQKFDNIIPMAKQGVKTDVSACNITINDARKKEVDFTDPYMDSNQGIAVAKNSGYADTDSLNAAGVKIAVQSGTTSEEWAQENLPNATTVNFDDWTAAFTAVMSGQCQAVVCDLPVEQWMVNSSFTDMEIIEEVPTGEQFGIAVSKDNPELTAAINAALKQIRADGRYDELYEKYFGTKPSSSSSSTTGAEGYSLVEDGKLTVASDLATPPFEYVDDSGNDQGFTFELMGKIANKLGLELNYLPAQKFDNIIPMVKQGVKTDVGACNITINDARKKEIDFTDSYMDSNQGIATVTGSKYDSLDSLNVKGVKIAAQSGTTSEEWATENLPNATVVTFDDWTAAFTAVMSDQCQAVICDLPVEQWMVKSSFTNMTIIKEIPTGEQFGIAVSKDNPELTAAINQALAELKESGEYDELYEKYFGSAPSSSDGASATSASEDASASEGSSSTLQVTKATARSNEDGGTNVLGGIATRLTWEATTGTEESVSKVTLALPEGGSFEDSSATVTVLNGLDRTDVEATAKVEKSNLAISFAEPIAAGSNVRIEVEGVVFPSSAGAYTVDGTYELADGSECDLPTSPTIAVTESTVVQNIVRWLDDQSWVEAWNANPFLGMFFKPQYVVTSIASLFQGWGIALLVTAIGFPLAIPIGLLFAFMKMSRRRYLRGIAICYINFLRGTPLFLQIYIAFFGLPMVGLNLPNLPLGVAVLAINCSAYLAEIFRAGIESISKGQHEAATALGMNWFQTMALIIIPQSIRRVIPTMTSEFVMLYKDTSLLSSVGVMELMMFSKNLTATTGNITPYICAALYYLVVTIPLIHFVGKIEKKLAAGGADAR